MFKFSQRYYASGYAMQILVVAIATVLSTRLFLNIAGYPYLLDLFRLNSDTLHISHIMFGGLFLYLGGAINLFFHGKKVRQLSAVFLGIGLGLFVDEVGKFITHDYNYFYQPAAMIIYIVFLLVFATYSYLVNSSYKQNEEKLYQIFEKFEEIIEEDFEITEKKYLLAQIESLSFSKKNTPFLALKKQLKYLVKNMPVKKDKSRQGWFDFLKKTIEEIYANFFLKPRFTRFIILFFVAYSISTLIESGYYLFFKNYKLVDYLLTNFSLPITASQPYILAIAQMTASTISNLFIIIGVYFYTSNKLKGLRYFKNGLVLKILLVRPFSFYFDQFSAAVGALFDICLLYGIELLLNKKTKE